MPNAGKSRFERYPRLTLVIVVLHAHMLVMFSACTSLKPSPVKDASIGASIGVDKNGWLYLIDLVEGGPAAKSGAILPGDRLAGIKTSPDTRDFVMVHTLTKEQVIDLVMGEKGTEITLWLLRDFKSRYVTLVRDRIPSEYSPAHP